MKLYAIAEATLEDVKNRIAIWSKKYGLSVEDIASVIQADPTRGKYSEWLIKQYLAKTIRMPEDNPKLLENLKKFDRVKPQLAEKDINKYTPGELARTLEQQLKLTKSERHQARRGDLQVPPGAKLVLDRGGYQVVKIDQIEKVQTHPLEPYNQAVGHSQSLSIKASEILCSGTEWCTANPENAASYLEMGPLYLIFKDGKRFALVHYESEQVKDIYDNEHDLQTKYEMYKLLEPVTNIYASGKNWPVDTDFPIKYAAEVLKQRWLEAEEYILHDTYASMVVDYAIEVIKGRWFEGEQQLLAEAKEEYEVQGNQKAFEHTTKAMVKYALEVIKGRWKEAEYYISKSPIPALQYAIRIIKGKWPEAENILMKDPELAFTYAAFTKQRFEKAEQYIKNSGYFAYLYAANVLKSKWPEAELYIKEDGYWPDYVRELGKIRESMKANGQR